MAGKNIEVELRGPLDETAYNNLMSVLNSRGTLIKKQNRFLLDYTTYIEKEKGEKMGERKLDIRVRTTNGKVEIIVKKGAFGGTSREEASVFPEGKSFIETLKLMSMLGYNKATACDRSIVRYMIDGIEIAVQDVNDFVHPGQIHSRFFEAEIMCSEEGEVGEAISKIRQFLSENNLTEFTEKEWYAYVEKMNIEANGEFDFERDSVDKIINLGQ